MRAHTDVHAHTHTHTYRHHSYVEREPLIFVPYILEILSFPQETKKLCFCFCFFNLNSRF